MGPRGLAAVRLAGFAACLVPGLLLVHDLLTGGLGANPVEALIRGLGDWALRLLLVTLAVTPVARSLGASWPFRLRRMLGLFAFGYAALHLIAYLVFENSLNPVLVLEDILERPYVLVGFTAFLLLLPLAVTSTDRWMRRLGGRWKRLHRLVYAAAPLAVLHFFLLVKADAWAEPLLYAGLLSLLLGWRLWRAIAPRATVRRSAGQRAPSRPLRPAQSRANCQATRPLREPRPRA